jgi:putative tryptophan/tyrosine transport system substrate-binding protein
MFKPLRFRCAQAASVPTLLVIRNLPARCKRASSGAAANRRECAMSRSFGSGQNVHDSSLQASGDYASFRPNDLGIRAGRVRNCLIMKRREFITLLGSAAVAWPRAPRAQQGERVRRIGVLMAYAESDPEAQTLVSAFRDGLQKLGWKEAHNIRIDLRWAASDVESMQRFAKELVALQPDVILSQTTPTTAALLQQTRTIPIVFATVADPVGSGFVASFPQPGGNVTGFNVSEPTLAGKFLELLKEIAPRVARVAMLFNPSTAPYAEIYLNPFKAAAASFGVEAITAPVHDRSELESVVAAHARTPNSGLIVMPDGFMNVHRAEVTSLAARYRLPAVYPYRFFAELGGLLSYGPDQTDNFRRAAAYVDRILKGAKPSELPVQAPIKFEMTINLKTAKALGLDVPLHLQQRADEVIE